MLGYSGDVCATPVAAVGELVITGWLDKARRFNLSRLQTVSRRSGFLPTNGC
jgi:hypothetical protein